MRRPPTVESLAREVRTLRLLVDRLLARGNPGPPPEPVALPETPPAPPSPS